MEAKDKSVDVFQIEFTEWVAENHYRLFNVVDGKSIWINEEGMKTTHQLLEIYNEETNR